jgi:hypothetical protein
MNLLPALALAALVSDDVCSARLDHLLAIYRDYGLPFPPPDAKLLRFEVPRGKYLELRRWTKADEERHKFHGTSARVVNPDPAALSGTEFADLELAVHCHARGWKPLACAAFRKWLATRAEQRAERQLACDAWAYWVDQISVEETPLPVVAKYLNRALPHTGCADEKQIALLRSLELSVVPSRSAPGSDDALIDQFIEGQKRGSPEWTDAYRALARRGFDAIPALIAHLGDDRLTRFSARTLLDTRADYLRVKDVVYRLLCAFAGRSLTESKDVAERTFAVGRWFADAQKTGEEEYVMTHVGLRDVPPYDDILLSRLVEKYPNRLPDAYRNFIEKQKKWDHLGGPFAKAIVESALPREDKLKILEFAATHANPRHRLTGLRHLLLVDPGRGSELLVAALDRMASDPESGESWLASLVGIGTDPKAWAALARTAKCVGPSVRVGLLSGVFIHWDDPSPANRRLQFAFVASHLNDTEAWDATGDRGLLQYFYLSEPLSQSEVRNYAAVSLLSVFRIWLAPQRDWTPQRWASVRECARIAIEHDLRR